MKYRIDIILHSTVPKFTVTTTVSRRSIPRCITLSPHVLALVSLRKSHKSPCLYSMILSGQAGAAAVKTIPIHDLVSDIIKGRRTAGITVHILFISCYHFYTLTISFLVLKEKITRKKDPPSFIHYKKYSCILIWTRTALYLDGTTLTKI